MSRTSIKEMRLALKKEEVMECSKACVSKVLQFPELIEAKTVCVYMPTGNEIDTTEIIRYCKENGKRFAAPRVNGDTMEFYYLWSRARKISGSRPEPKRFMMRKAW